MKTIFSIILITVTTLSMASTPKEIACQAWTFNRFTLEETLPKLNELGVKKIEMFPNQTLFNGEELKSGYDMNEETRARVNAMLKKHGVKLVSYGVVSPKTEKEWIKLMDFAKTMKIEVIVTEPPYDKLDMVDKLAQQYKIKVAIHNHPTPTKYWDPAFVKEKLAGKSKYMGVCADVGHWTRSGLDAVESLKLLEGHLFEIHYKDVNTTDKTGHCVIWGTGKLDMPAIHTELKRQKFKGNIVIEYEYNWEKSVPDIKKSIVAYTAAKQN